MELKFYTCAVCGKVIAVMNNPGTPTFCCGQEMKELIPGKTDGDEEKHIPVISVKGDRATVCIGSKEHPSTDEHYIQWITLVTSRSIQHKILKAGEKPCATFALLPGEEVISAYDYCNIHKLWKQYNYMECC